MEERKEEDTGNVRGRRSVAIGVLEGEVYELDTDMHVFSHSVVKYLRLAVFFK